MKNYTITVNGKAYDVTVEENGASAGAVAAPKASTKVEKKVEAPAGGEGSIKIEAGAAGKVFKIEKHQGDSVSAGDTVMVLEVMKMETPVVAPKDGTIASINVQEGQSIEANALLATMNE